MRFLLVLCLVSTRLYADDVTPQPIPIVAVKAEEGVEGKGTREAPYLFTTGDLGQLAVESAGVRWYVKDAPPKTRVFEGKDSSGKAIGMISFPTSQPGEYHVFCLLSSTTPEAIDAWFVIHSGSGPPPGPNPKPVPTQTLTQRVVKAFVPTDPAITPEQIKTDAVILRASMESVRDNVAGGKITTLKALEVSMGTALKATGWPVGRYPDISKLMGELFGVDVSDRPLGVDERKKITEQLTTISAAAAEVSSKKAGA